MIHRNKRAAAVLAGATAFTLGFGCSINAAVLTWDSAGASPAAPVDGSGTWDNTSLLWSNGTTDIAWPNDTVTTAAFGSGNGAAGTVTLGSAITANGLAFNAAGSSNYTIAGTGSNTLTLAGTTPTISIAGGQSPTISAVIAGTAGVAVTQTGTGTGQITLSGTNTYTGGTTIGANAQVNFTVTANLGAASSAVTLNGGTLNYAGTSGGPTVSHVINGTGGTINTTATGGNGKFILNTGGALGGSGTIIKAGPGWLTDYGAAVAGSTFNTEIDGGVFEVGSQTALGTGAVVVNSGGEVALNIAGKPVANALTVNGGTIGTDSAANTYSGALTFAGRTSSNIRLGNFYSNAPQSLAISGSLAGSGTINLINGLGATAPSAQLLTLSGTANSNFTGTLNVDAGHGVIFTTAASVPGGSIVATGSTSALPIVGDSYGTSTVPAVTDNTNGNGGVFSFTGSFASQALNLSTLYGGKWFLGSISGGSYYGTITPGFDTGGNPLYRLGGGNTTAALNIFPLLANAANSGGALSSAGVQVGDPRIGGGGIVKFQSAETYTGATNLVNGTLQFGAAAGGVGGGGALPITTLVTFGAAANAANGTSATAGTLDLLGLNTPVGGLSVAAGAVAANQFVTNSSTTANSILTVDTSNFGSTFAGIIKNGASKTIGLTVQGTAPANAITLSGADTYTGATTVNGGTLLINGSLANTAVTVATGGIFGGNGSVAGTVTVNGHLSPGSGGAGVLTVNNAVALAGGSFLDFDLNTAGAAGTAGNDLLAINGALTLNPNLTVDLIPGTAFGNGTYPLASFITLTDNSAAFSGWAVSGLPAGDSATFNLSGNALNLVVNTAVPEPSAVLTTTIAAASLLASRRRRVAVDALRTA